jgi:hypothetical protein
VCISFLYYALLVCDDLTQAFKEEGEKVNVMNLKDEGRSLVRVHRRRRWNVRMVTARAAG